ncbi:amidohydrolase family protein [Variovorax rhizosphaerae]|uniref:Amidohydrolase family protein n=1 Tax=Variovorax rhizosphaerae TaxID=1836200 RepID=A0ABU8WL56_9BURK
MAAPALSIVDSHHHLWMRDGQRYLLDEFAADIADCGHDIAATVYVECGAMLRRTGPSHLRCVGEAQFVAGVAAMSESGLFGPARICAAFVGAADLSLGAEVDEVLDALHQASAGRLRGIRGAVASDPDPAINVGGRAHAPAGLMRDVRYRAGVARLAARGLVYDAWQYHPQLVELCELADAFPTLTIVVNHCGGPLGIGPYRREDNFAPWRTLVAELARRPNVCMKLGGMSRKRCGFDFEDRVSPPSIAELVQAWQPYMQTCIELFGADRCMFESNFPPDQVAGSYGDVWTALLRTPAGCSDSQLRALAGGTAKRVYRIG